MSTVKRREVIRNHLVSLSNLLIWVIYFIKLDKVNNVEVHNFQFNLRTKHFRLNLSACFVKTIVLQFVNNYLLKAAVRETFSECTSGVNYIVSLGKTLNSFPRETILHFYSHKIQIIKLSTKHFLFSMYSEEYWEINKKSTDFIGFSNWFGRKRRVALRCSVIYIYTYTIYIYAQQLTFIQAQ